MVWCRLALIWTLMTRTLMCLHTGIPAAPDGGGRHRPRCLECDDGSDSSDGSSSNHSPQACPVVQGLRYPPDVAPQLPKLEAWMARAMGRVQTLDRARAWLKAREWMCLGFGFLVCGLV